MPYSRDVIGAARAIAAQRCGRPRRPSAAETIASDSTDGIPGPGCPAVPVSSVKSQREGCSPARAPRRPGLPAPGGPPCVWKFDAHQEIRSLLRTKEVGRGWNASAADARPGPPGMVRTPPAAAVRPFPGVRRPGPRPGLATDGQPPACLDRVSTMSTIRAGATHDFAGPLLVGGANPRTLYHKCKMIRYPDANYTSTSLGRDQK
jgi:hypothetical protein